MDGIDIMGRFGIDLVVVPHWNNAEGGNHDTQRCFVGEPRFRKLVEILPEPLPILGLDEHTACILDLAADEATVKGIGTVTYLTGDREMVFKTGETFPLQVLRGESMEADWKSRTPASQASQKTAATPKNTFWDKVHTLEESFHHGLEERDVRKSTNSLLELDRTIWQAQNDLESEESIVEARDTLRELIVLLGSKLASSPQNQVEFLTPLVDDLVSLRQKARDEKQWQVADGIRDALSRINISVEDDADGSRWRLETEPDDPDV